MQAPSMNRQAAGAGMAASAPCAGGIECRYEDEALLVLEKPAELLSVPGRGPDKQDCAASRAARRWPDARVVHRLDMSTSGLLLMARGSWAQRRLGEAFAMRRVDKRYLAWVHDPSSALQPVADDSSPDEGWTQIDLPLAADWPRRPRQRVDPAGRPSVTRWRCLDVDRSAGRARLELNPLTGRAHQLRVHLAAIGHAICGDRLYADPVAAAVEPRLLLHAWRLALRHPIDERRLRFESPAPF